LITHFRRVVDEELAITRIPPHVPGVPVCEVNTMGFEPVPTADRDPVLPTTSDLPDANTIVVPGRMVRVAPAEMVSVEAEGMIT
jgi:hypothetical protein